MIKNKKIIIVHGYMDMGGVEKALLALLEALENSEFTIKLLLFRSGGVLYNDIPKWVEIEILEGYAKWNFLIFDAPLTTSKRYFKQQQILNGFKAIYRALCIKLSSRDLWYLNYKDFLNKINTTYECDIAISFRGLDLLVPYFVIEKVKANTKLMWIHGDIKNHISNNQKFPEKLYPKFNKIYGVSEDVKNSIIEMFPNLLEKVDVFRNIVPEEKIKLLANLNRGYNDNFKGFRLLTIGRLHKLKGQDRIPEVVKRLKDLGYNFRWYLVGDGVLENEIKSQIKQMNIEEHLILLGNQMNPYPFIKNCDIYVVPSRTEGASVVMHEVKILKKPIVTTDVASSELFVKNNVDGFIMSNDIDGIFNGIRHLLEESHLIEEFSTFSNLLLSDYRSDIDKLSNFVK